MLRVNLMFTFLVVAFSASLFAEDKPKTVAEKLIGKWKLVKSGEELPEGVAATLELMKAGKYLRGLFPASAIILHFHHLGIVFQNIGEANRS